MEINAILQFSIRIDIKDNGSDIDEHELWFYNLLLYPVQKFYCIAFRVNAC